MLLTAPVLPLTKDGLPLIYTLLTIGLVAITFAVIAYKLSRSTPASPYQYIENRSGLQEAQKTRLRPVFGYWHTYLWGRGKAAPVDVETARQVTDMMLDVKTFHRDRKQP